MPILFYRLTVVKYNNTWILLNFMLINHNREKLINSIVYFLRNTKYCGKTKLFKLLYFLDFIHFRETGKSVTGLHYFAWDKGPVPKDLFYELKCPKEDLCQYVFVPKDKESDDFFEMKPKGKFDNRYFSGRELKLLEKIAYIFRDARAPEIVETTHLPNMPWDKTIKKKGEDEEIDYFLALDDSEQSLSPNEVKERIHDSEEIKNLFR